ncbi:Lmo1p NDAI_0C02480 [Naumovozyma dairenensis CBS 421]|uniref:PH domain-containing protein n=1 Tax=Naumovozyma dairenensis (strain ATCC 10597 / BCRC 20456 / CBS 421 / NBRC 0211 / NRRL Y-12639) TaxID=1071378 RepID=G0W7Z7_NAUDC|nr:hypothetical protein NDAI_0C02480 [Naumovozyma dairenensis CBS 421]CCD23908.1 hypothetical protein NDAI_0C02480 [Naumovozyma dairenensis CBS 421]
MTTESKQRTLIETLRFLQEKSEAAESSCVLTHDEASQCYQATYSSMPELQTNSEVLNDANNVLSTLIPMTSSYDLSKTVLTNPKFWSLFTYLIPTMDVQMFTTNFRLVFEVLLNPSFKNHETSLVMICKFMQTKRIILDTLVANLSSLPLETSSQLIIDTIICISLYLESLNALSKFDRHTAALVIPETCLHLVDCGWPNIVTALLLSKNRDVSQVIIERFIRNKRQLCDFMSAFKLSDYGKTTLSDRLFNAVNNVLPTINNWMYEFNENANEEYIDLLNLSFLQAYDIITFLENPSLSFKKSFSEQLLFGENPFPLYETLFRVSDELHTFFCRNDKNLKVNPHIPCLLLNKEAFIYALMDNQLKLWIDSGSKSKEDINSLLTLLPVILEKVNRILSSEKSPSSPQSHLTTAGSPSVSSTSLVAFSQSKSNLNKTLSIIQSLTYKTARQWQLDELKSTHYKKWARHMSGFDKLLSNQVVDYVTHQRLLQLQKGAWVYAENPLDSNIKVPKLYFLVVSDNHANLLIREFNTKQDELPIVEENKIWKNNEERSNIPIHSSYSSANRQENNPGKTTKMQDKDVPRRETIVIPLKHIVHFEKRELNRHISNDKIFEDEKSSKNLVNLVHTTLYTEAKLSDKNRKHIFKFYLDSKEAAYIWLDGLQLISSSKHKADISGETKKQIETLIDLRKNVQMIYLNIDDDLELSEVDTDDEEFDLETLKNLSTDFFYE